MSLRSRRYARGSSNSSAPREAAPVQRPIVGSATSCPSHSLAALDAPDGRVPFAEPGGNSDVAEVLAESHAKEVSHLAGPSEAVPLIETDGTLEGFCCAQGDSGVAEAGDLRHGLPK